MTSSCISCDEPARTKGRCHAHYQRLRRGSDSGPIRRRGSVREPWTNWSDTEKVRNVGLSGAHSRVARLWGRAADYECYECNGKAAQWAYDGTDPTQLLGVKDSTNAVPMWYSAYPEFYAPMCFKCHKLKDRTLMYSELTEYRKMKAGI